MMPVLSAKNWNWLSPTASGELPPWTRSPSLTRTVLGTAQSSSSGTFGTLLLPRGGKRIVGSRR